MENVLERTDNIATRRTILSDPAPSVYDDTTTSRRIGSFPAAALNSPMFEGKDIAGLIGAIVITLGPLAAYSLGWGA